MNRYKILFFITAGFLAGTILNCQITDHLHLELNHHEIEKNSHYFDSLTDKEKDDIREKNYLHTNQYEDYRNFCERKGLGYLEYEKERDYKNGGRYDTDRGWEPSGNLTKGDRD